MITIDHRLNNQILKNGHALGAAPLWTSAMLKPCRNELLSSLLEGDLRSLAMHLEDVPLWPFAVIEAAHYPVEHIYFPETGLVSVKLTDKRRGAAVEIGMVGRDGMTGLAMVLGDGYPVTKTVVQIAGTAKRIAAAKLRTLLEGRSTLQRCFLRYAYTFALQTSYTAFANGRGCVPERLARWLLMCLDRQDESTINITHDFIADALGSRRAGITDALKGLRTQGIITHGRGEIVVLDRSGLEKAAGQFYGVPEREQRRLISARRDYSYGQEAIADNVSSA
jgi:CRP-like cAMP-binding protein